MAKVAYDVRAANVFGGVTVYIGTITMPATATLEEIQLCANAAASEVTGRELQSSEVYFARAYQPA